MKFRPAAILKRDYKTVAFLWILGNFQKPLFWRTSANNCFYDFKKIRVETQQHKKGVCIYNRETFRAKVINVIF